MEAIMLADELLFMGGHVAHISAYYERMRQARIRATSKRIADTYVRSFISQRLRDHKHGV